MDQVVGVPWAEKVGSTRGPVQQRTTREHADRLTVRAEGVGEVSERMARRGQHTNPHARTHHSSSPSRMGVRAYKTASSPFTKYPAPVNSAKARPPVT